MGVRIVGVLALLLGLLISGLVGISYWTLGAKGESFPGGLHQPALAIEMARSPVEVNQIEQTLAAVKGYTVGNSTRLDIERARDFLTRGVKQDFFFIAIYTLLNLAFCYWLSERELGNRRLSLGLGIFAAVCAAIAALSDVVENFRLFEVLGGQRSDEMLRELSLATYMKWSSFFLMLALLSLLFLRRALWPSVIGILFLLVSVVGTVGLFGPRQALELAFGLLGISMFLAGLEMLRNPSGFVSGLRKPDGS